MSSVLAAVGGCKNGRVPIQTRPTNLGGDVSGVEALGVNLSRLAVLQAIVEHPRSTVTELSSLTGLNRSTVREQARSLVEGHLVAAVGRPIRRSPTRYVADDEAIRAVLRGISRRVLPHGSDPQVADGESGSDAADATE
ncbi:winged helix-turn-helix domain-containing protein (plasmid) [Propionibacterium freudenreichii]|uniref:winged helix-turn-helix domain-containing protein n=1 Tax=Propionibacterium freudenreichii TaxID=1744 RepID=UPI002A0F7037|nr:ArsR family transcriptional regulator [Propionibacterium freudenreichii]MDK9676547.1 winged helix-turn-helix transcriptional regulator [Propionibacterium freudenreichii]